MHSAFKAAAEQADDDSAIPAVQDARGLALVGVQAEAAPAEDGGQLWRLRLHRHKVGAEPLLEARVGDDVESEEARRVEVAEAAEEDGVRRGAEPAPTDGGGADEVRGEP